MTGVQTCALPISDIQALVSTLTQEQQQILSDEVGAELDRGRMGFSFTTVTNPQMPNTVAPPVTTVLVALQKAAFIPDLTELKFSEAIDDLNFTVNFVKIETKLYVKKLATTKSTSSTSKTITQN